MAERPRVLILGGTAEAVALAEAAAERYAVTYSLAGRTRAPVLPGRVEVRTGGFGGAAALAGWIAANRIAAVLDATHPYADRIARNAAEACTKAGTPRIKLLRPAWTPRDGDDWRDTTDLAGAARLLPGLGARAFLSLGRDDLAAFAGVSGVHFLVRTIDPLDGTPLANAACITGRGPFAVADETALLRDHAIDVVVSRNAGGEATYAKIAAARALALPVVMVARPAPPTGPTVAGVAEATDQLEDIIREKPE